MSARIDLKTRTFRFTVNRLKADMKFHPKGMIFKNLDLQTLTGLRNYYAVRYDDFNHDMGHYIEKEDGSQFTNGTISSKI
jgi:hypothetical protein